MWVATQIDYHTLMGQVPVLYAVTVALLIGTFLVGTAYSVRGAGSGMRELQVPGLGIRQIGDNIAGSPISVGAEG